ncbi:D-alanyl-D-alanine carboxypeptidase/D-alanyl-D-alanine-endopeptidase [Chitiniphilus purpureus]|uniref:D-alanyl-D-alanine carboxypeptidase/D-alanyl-D-alanine-endopeptidase n=1 Tax=Chitiniphilus purpureus TaxID=2981137 RepID=A0ABY6DME0_9NEIS|nr:D-alanyl-D-alanine carboxypeptidase/D-alanyl-D-alanine-endopeptidase [Chitiniphilus sp. CD1]UXY14651.1 D-alanyl-D-alanine carboxypeptidase/D-alanyl-D-alanine-endopeptidase [Chitiniphilus sp. CD1]
MRSLHCVLLVAAGHLSPAFAAELSGPPAPVLTAMRAARLPAEALALAVVPLSQPQAAQYFNADNVMNPASVMKLVTTQVALEKLGPAYAWTTELLADGPVAGGMLKGNLYLKGAGDPKLTYERLWMLLRDLRAAGVQRVTGDVVLDRGALRLPPPGVFDDDEGDPARPFLVAPDALLANFKSVRVRVLADGGSVRVGIEPPLPEISVENSATVSGHSCEGVAIVAQSDATRAKVRVSGVLAEGCHSERYVSVLDTATYTGTLVRSLWRELGGEIAGAVRTGATPAGARILAGSRSPDLVSVIRDVNKFSNNLMARQLFLALGAAHRQGETDDALAAARVVREWLAENQLRWPELVLENGSGLSRKERISARHLGELLLRAAQGAYAAEFVSSLPIVALDGTMKKRLRGSEVAGAAHIKTGTLKNVRAIAGYVQAVDGRRYAVVGIVNHPTASAAAPALDALLAWVRAGGAELAPADK